MDIYVQVRQDGRNSCVARAISEACGLDYASLRETLHRLNRINQEKRGWPVSDEDDFSVDTTVWKSYLRGMGWKRMTNQATVRRTSVGKALKAGHLPDNCIVHTKLHLIGIRDGRIRDSFNSSRKIVKEVWIPAPELGSGLRQDNPILRRTLDILTSVRADLFYKDGTELSLPAPASSAAAADIVRIDEVLTDVIGNLRKRLGEDRDEFGLPLVFDPSRPSVRRSDEWVVRELYEGHPLLGDDVPHKETYCLLPSGRIVKRRYSGGLTSDWYAASRTDFGLELPDELHEDEAKVPDSLYALVLREHNKALMRQRWRGTQPWPKTKGWPTPTSAGKENATDRKLPTCPHCGSIHLDMKFPVEPDPTHSGPDVRYRHDPNGIIAVSCFDCGLSWTKPLPNSDTEPKENEMRLDTYPERAANRERYISKEQLNETEQAAIGKGLVLSSSQLYQLAGIRRDVERDQRFGFIPKPQDFDVIIVQRDAMGLLYRLAGIIEDDAQTVTGVPKSDVRDSIVLGQLPLHLAAVAKLTVVVNIVPPFRSEHPSLAELLNRYEGISVYEVNQPAANRGLSL